MDLIGEIVEHDVEVPQPPTSISSNGFPSPTKLREKKASKWKQRQKEKEVLKNKVQPEAERVELTEAEKIHRENLERMSKMTEEDIIQEREELLNGLDSKLIQSLLKRTEKRLNKPSGSYSDEDAAHRHKHHVHSEGYNQWIGSIRTKDGLTDLSHLDAEDVDRALGLKDLKLEDDLREDITATGKLAEDSSGELSSQVVNKKDKTVRFKNVTTIKYEELDDSVELDQNGWEDVEDINDLIPTNPEDQIAHDDYQLVQDENNEARTPSVHFPKPLSKANQGEDLDLNDPDFFEKLHEKYYPDLPKETTKLSWMTEPLPKHVPNIYESISDMRFDFKGDLIELNDVSKNEDKEIPMYLGLHHHSENPHLAGYTLSELAHLSRSVLPGQRCVSIQTLGRILHKLGLHKYKILPISDKDEDKEFNENLKDLTTNFEKLMWDLINELRIVESITEASDESKTKNLSVRNYAIEALWLWKQGGGRPEFIVETEEDIITKVLQ